ncbi:MAG: HEAT repeat domain-containing protein [Elusimicrobia bacterium]|nr:HEAT repeat domain-containing protein [Elusimicrobiota bacterium]
MSIKVAAMLAAGLGLLISTANAALIDSPARVVELLHNQDWQQRARAVSYASASALKDDKVRSALIETLVSENQAHEQWYADYVAGKNPLGFNKTKGEGYGEYYGDLVALVAKQKIPGSLEALVTADGGQQAAVSAFGSEAARSMIAHFRLTKNAFNRVAIIRTLGKMAKAGQITGSLKEDSKALVYNEATKDHDPEVRKSAVENLLRFDKDQAAKVLKVIAESDDRSYVRKTDNVKVYPVRDAAKKELDKIQK